MSAAVNPAGGWIVRAEERRALLFNNLEGDCKWRRKKRKKAERKRRRKGITKEEEAKEGAGKKAAGKKKSAKKKKKAGKKKKASKAARPMASPAAPMAALLRAVERCDLQRETRAESSGRLAVPNGFPAVTGNTGERAGAKAPAGPRSSADRLVQSAQERDLGRSARLPYSRARFYPRGFRLSRLREAS